MKEKLVRAWRQFWYNYYMQLYSSCEQGKQKERLLKKARFYKFS